MPRSRQRHKHRSHIQQHVANRKPKRKAAPVMTIFFGLVGLVIAVFASDSDIFWMSLGLIIGAGVGFIIGRNLDKSTTR